MTNLAALRGAWFIYKRYRLSVAFRPDKVADKRGARQRTNGARRRGAPCPIDRRSPTSCTRSNMSPGLTKRSASGLFGDVDAETVAAVISEAGRFATEALAPLNRIGD